MKKLTKESFNSLQNSLSVFKFAGTDGNNWGQLVCIKLLEDYILQN